MTKVSSVTRLLTDTIAASLGEASHFSADTFFQKWFPNSGRYFFLFTKNLSVTNIQYAELIALIRRYTTAAAGARPNNDLLFLTTDDFHRSLTDAIADLTDGFSHHSSQVSSLVSTFAEQYTPVLSRTVVLDPYYGSAAFYLPQHIRLDLSAVCAHAGYVHSCGYNVFLRPTTDAIPQAFYDALSQSLDERASTKPILFVVYAQEDFTPFDRHEASRLRHGLDDVKIPLEKFYIGNRRLSEILLDLAAEFAGQLHIPPPGDYRKKTLEYRRKHNLELGRTFWLIIDRGIGRYLGRSASSYLICYDQYYANASPFQVFDENKPAWVSHTTTPHSLVAAMLNLALSTRGQSEELVVCDPFVGTGTTWFETLRYPEIVFRGFDIDPLASFLIRDNLQVLTLASEELEEMATTLRTAGKWMTENRGRQKELALPGEEGLSAESLEEAVSLADALDEKGLETSEAKLSSELLVRLKSLRLADRVLFYVALRARRRHIGAFRRQALEWGDAYSSEAEVLADQFSRLARRYRRSAERIADGRGRNILFHGHYSYETTIAPGTLEVGESGVDGVVRRRPVQELDERSYDVIIADPPYGFNTEADVQELAELYRQMVARLVRGVKDGGDILLALPERSFTGRRLPVCTRRELVTFQFLAEAEEGGREIVVPATTVPRLPLSFRPPYFWESERALRRAILHFKVRDRR